MPEKFADIRSASRRRFSQKTAATGVRAFVAQPWVRKLSVTLFFAVIAVLLTMAARRVEWREVIGVLRDYRARTLYLGGAMVTVSYLVYSTFDLFGRHFSRHHVAVGRTMLIGFISYAFTLTLTTWVGGVAMRFRLYSRLGVAKGAIAQIFTISLLTNWIGFLLLASIAGASGFIPVPKQWAIGADAMRVVGAALIIPVLIYLGYCYRFPDQTHVVLKQKIQLPGFGVALLQVIMGALHWATMAAAIWILLDRQVDYIEVLGILLLSTVAVFVIHIPAGLGVIEAVFVAMLHRSIGHQHILAALICYRAFFYLAPLLLATIAFAVLELSARRAGSRND
jgi:uncharacterized membrane protein YbhN (UPF0104 family)